MQIPNAVWISILVAATEIVNRYYDGSVWAPLAVALLAMAIKALQVKSTEAAAMARGAAPQDSAMRRWLLG